MEELSRRVACLERENRWLKRIGLAVLLVIALPVLIAAAPRRGSGFKVNALQIVDAEGRIRARLSVENGQPGLLLLDEKGVIRTAHCALGWMRADAAGRPTSRAGTPSCVPSTPAEAPPPGKGFSTTKE